MCHASEMMSSYTHASQILPNEIKLEEQTINKSCFGVLKCYLRTRGGSYISLQNFGKASF